MEKDVFFCLVASVGHRKNSECFYAVPLSHKDSMESKAHHEFHIQNMTLATLMIPTVCRRHVIYELCNRKMLIIEPLWLSGRVSVCGIRKS